MSAPQYIHETHIMPDALLPFIFHTDKTKSSRIAPNWHENIELLCFIEGTGHLKCGVERYPVCAGDIAVINPDVLHMTEGNLTYHCLIIDRSFCEDNGIPILSLYFREIIKSEELFAAFCDAVEEIKKARSVPDPICSVPEVRHRILGLLLSLCREHIISESPEKKAHSASADRAKGIMTYMRKNFAKSISLDDIAEHIGISKYHLSREFKQLTGTTIFDSLNIIRCKEARHMLSDGATVSETAYACGFENLSYFSRTFKKYTGKLPSEYMKEK